MSKKPIFLFITISFILGFAIFFISQEVFGVTFGNHIFMAQNKISHLTYNAAEDAVDKAYVDSYAAGDADWTISGDNIYRTTGRVGIGTSSPGAKLHVKTTSAQQCVGEPYPCESYDGDQTGCNNQQGCSWTSKSCFGLSQSECTYSGCWWEAEGFCSESVLSLSVEVSILIHIYHL